MPAEQDAYEPGPAEFERIVSRLRAEDPQFRGDPRVGDAGRLPPSAAPAHSQNGGDGPFVLACLAVILPLSLLVGGWIGLAAMMTSVLVASRLVLHAAVNQPR